MIDFLIKATSKIITDNSNVPNIDSQWSKESSSYTCNIVNSGYNDVSIKEVILFKGRFPYDPRTTKVYGEGYTKLSQYGGTLSRTVNVGDFSDHGHYKLKKKEGYNTVYNLLILSPKEDHHVLMGFSSCHRFSGEFRFNDKGEFEIVMNTEGIQIKAGDILRMEELIIIEGEDSNALLQKFGERISFNHPTLKVESIPSGWCSWHCYGPDVTEQNIIDNMKAIKNNHLDLKYIQIDDGYQSFMGDWLDTHPNFGKNAKHLCIDIKENGFEPAIWVAPFIAEKDSKLFKEHPDWFVKDENGIFLSSDEITFGGWRCQPWYMLDGTHPEACEYLTHVFKTMREEWKCSYFKLDANYWGAVPGGHYYDENATSVEAYRRGMSAVLEGSKDAFILGCNAPMWPSLGLVHGMRTGNDVCRSWESFKSLAYQLFHRNWQHQKLWINDPDCAVLQDGRENVLGPDGSYVTVEMPPQNAYSFNAAYILATGGMVLSGDDITKMSTETVKVTQALVDGNHNAAVFEDDKYDVGTVKLSEKAEIKCLFNWSEKEKTVKFEFSEDVYIIDYFTDNEIDKNGSSCEIQLKPTSAKAIKLTFNT